MRVKLIAFLFLSTLFIGGCGNINNTSKDDSLTFGVILPLSDIWAKQGNDARIGIEIAQDNLKEQYPNIKLIFEDGKFSPTAAVQAFNQLVNLQDADAIIGPLNGSSIESLRTLAHTHKTILMTPWGSANKMDNWLLKSSSESKDEVAAILNLGITQQKHTKPGILYMNNDFGHKQMEEFVKQTKELGYPTVAVEPFNLGTKDWRTELLKIKNAGADMVYITFSSGALGEVTNQAVELGYTPQFFSTYATETPDLIPIGGKSLEELAYPHSVTDRNPNERQKKFISEFKKRTDGDYPGIVAFHAYDIYVQLAEAFDACKNSENETCIGEHVLNSGTVDGISGIYEYKDGEIRRPFFMKAIRNGEYVYYE